MEIYRLCVFLYFIAINTFKQITGQPSSSNSNITSESTTTKPTDSEILSNDKFTESDVKELVALGFTRDQAIYELRRFNGDKTQATAALFAKSLKF